MPNDTIDLRKLRETLRGRRVTPENELPAPKDEPLLETAGTTDHEETHPHDELKAGSLLIQWEAPDFDATEGSRLLLLAAGALLILGAVAAAFFRNSPFAFFLAIAGGLLISYAYRAPRNIRFAVTARGVTVSGRLYEFENLQSFWIAYDPPLFKEVRLVSKKAIMPVLRIPLNSTDPLRVREILLRFLPEKKHEDGLIDILTRHLGF